MKKFASFWLIFGAFYSMATAHTTSVPPEVVVEGTISTPTTWTADKVWVIESAVYIETDLTIEAGTTVRFRSNASLNIGTNQFGSILAEGLTEKPILFTSAATSPSPGDWLYINLGQHNASSRTKFTHCTFEYGGGDDWGTVYVGNTAISMSSCTIRASKSVGLYLESGAKLKLYENNSISECGESAVVADLNSVAGLGSSSHISTAEGYGILVKGSTEILGKTTWAKQDVPYYITETFYVQNEKGNAELTIGSGAKIKFGPGVSLQVGQSNYGKFVATGVTFTTAAGSPSAGDWAYIWFGEHAAAGSGLSDCVVEYGGSDESYGSVAISANSKVFVQRCTIQNSASYGIYMEFAKPILTQNTFNNIAAENEFTRE